MSMIAARAIQTQSKPVTPPRNTIAYINVVQGASRNPMKASQKLSNAASHRAESINHRTKKATRGPRKNSKVNMQHIRQFLSEPAGQLDPSKRPQDGTSSWYRRGTLNSSRNPGESPGQQVCARGSDRGYTGRIGRARRCP
jgi:hypothetical protein